MSRDILLLVNALAHEKNVDYSIVFSALESALASATKRRFIDEEVDIRVVIDRETGMHQAFRRWCVVEDDNLDDPAYQIQIAQAQKRYGGVELGQFVEEQLDEIEFGRVSAQAAKQVIMQKIREAEREQILRDFLERSEKLVNGTIKRMDKGHAIIECGRIEAILRRDQMIPKENLRIGDRVKAYILKVDPTARGPQIELSRTAPEFIIELFRFEVPEVDEGLLEIRSAARDPGLRAKISIKSNDPRVDPIGTCVGIRGSRVTAVTNELAGERVDIVLWSSDPAEFVIGALAPATVNRIIIDEERHSMNVVVDDNELAIAIGRGGQNVRLASELTSWQINLMTVEERQQKDQEELMEVSRLFVEALDIHDDVVEVLISEGFSSIEEVAYVPISEMLKIEGFDEGIVEELRNRARSWLLTKAIASEEQTEHSIISLPEMDETLLAKLETHDIVSLNDLADLSIDELVEITSINETRARNIILAARKHWFDE